MKHIYNNRNYSSRNFLESPVELQFPLKEKAIAIQTSPFWSLIDAEVIGSVFINKSYPSLKFFRISKTNDLVYIDQKIVKNGSQIMNKNEVLLFSPTEKKVKCYDKNFEELREIYTEEHPTYADENNFYIFTYKPNEGYTLEKKSIKGELIWETLNNYGGMFLGLTPEVVLFNGDNFQNKLDQKNESIICLSQNNGLVLWEIFIPHLVKNPVLIAKERVIVESQTLGVVCLDLKTGEILWAFKRLSFQYCRKYTLDYNEVLHLIEVDSYYQIDIKDGSIIKEFSLANHYRQLKLKQALSNSGNDNFSNFFGSFSFFPTVTEDHFIIALFSNILFLNKNSGTLDYHYALPEKNSIVHELAVIDNNRILIRNNVFSGKMKGNVLRILESKR